MQPTIKDIVKLTGLAPATISRHLNNIKVRKGNAEAIDAAIKKLDYNVNEVARGLRINKTKMIGLIFPKINDIFAANLIYYVQDFLEEQGYTTLLATSNAEPEREISSVRYLLSRQVDGIITIPIYPASGAYDLANERNVPVAFLDVDLCDIGDSIFVDNEKIGRTAAELFLERNIEKVAIVCGIKGAYTANKRFDGFCQVFRERGNREYERYIMRGDTTERAGYQAAEALIKRSDPPDGIFCTNYFITLGVITAINEYGLTVGKDVSVVAVDNFHMTEIIRPKLVVFEQPIKEMAEKAVAMLIARIESGNYSENREAVMLDPILRKGDSLRAYNTD